MGGPAQGIRNLVPELEKLGWKNTVCCLDDPADEYGLRDPFDVVKLGRGVGPLRYNKKLKSWLTDHLPDYEIVLIHGLWQYPSACTAGAIRRLRSQNRNAPALFVMPHGMLDPWFQDDPSRKWKARRNWLYWKAIEQRTIATADAVLFTCQRELELARKPFRPYRPKREINVGYGIAAPPAHSSEMSHAFEQVCGSLQGRPYLLYLSRIDPKKGVDLLVDAYLGLSQQGLAGKCELPDLVIAGPNDSPYAQDLMRRSVGCPGIHWLGMLVGDAKWGALYGSEAFILPSHQENFGIAVVEAMACGKPVLISDQVNIYPEIQASNAGYVEPDTAGGVDALLKRWFDCTLDERQAMASGAASGFQDRFSASAAAKRLVDQVQTTLASCDQNISVR